MHQEGEILKDRYIVQSIIGNGGSGFVYLAFDKNVGKVWAIKEIDKCKTYGRNLADSEMQMLKSLDHPMFPRIVDAWRESDLTYIVSDYIDGISLGQLIKAGSFSKKRTYDLAVQIAEAISYLHSQNPPVLYLDLKPDNILIKSNGKAYLVDFGIACSVNKTFTGFGTPGFAPPEQYGGSNGCVSERSDVYAFGVTYFTIRTGCYPDPDANRMAELVRSSTSISARERQFILQCIHINPDKRIDSMEHVRANLIHINNSHLKGYIGSFAVASIIVFTLILSRVYFSQNVDDTAVLMIQEAMDHSVNGEYTLESLKIMSAYINEGRLSDADREYYLFEIARTYFEVYGDYREAKRYFEMLDGTICEQKNYYLKLCEFQTGFEYDANEISICLDDYMKNISMMHVSEEKYKNLLFIAFCYTIYYPAESEEFLKGKKILDSVYASLLELEKDGVKEIWIDEIKNECVKRIDGLEGF